MIIDITSTKQLPTNYILLDGMPDDHENIAVYLYRNPYPTYCIGLRYIPGASHNPLHGGRIPDSPTEIPELSGYDGRRPPRGVTLRGSSLQVHGFPGRTKKVDRCQACI